MSLRNEGLTKAFTAGAAVATRRFVKFDTSDSIVIQGAAAADFIIGVSDLAAALGERLDVILDGIVTVEAGGTVTRGQLVMSDSVGRAITASAAAGTNVRTAGVAMASAASGDLFPVFLVPGSFQG